MNVSLRSCEVVSTLSICRCLRGTLALPLPRSHKTLSQSVKQQQTLTARATFLDTAWSTTLNPETLADVVAPQLFAFSLFPYLGFLYHLTKAKKVANAPPVMVFGFYFLLVFVFATIPAGIYAKTHYGTSLSNVDWLHGSAESMLTVTNLLIIVGLRRGIAKETAAAQQIRSEAHAASSDGQDALQVAAPTKESADR